MKAYTVTKIANQPQRCCWCDEKAEYTVRDNDVEWTDCACKEHLEKWFPQTLAAN